MKPDPHQLIFDKTKPSGKSHATGSSIRAPEGGGQPRSHKKGVFTQNLNTDWEIRVQSKANNLTQSLCWRMALNPI